MSPVSLEGLRKQVQSLEKGRQREVEALQRQLQGEKEESSNAQQKLQLEITQLQTQIAHTQDSLRLLKASPQSDSVAQQVYIARRQMLEAFTCALSHWRARTLMHETLLLWQQWLQQRRALALTVCETRQDIQQRAVQSLEVMARHARIRTCYQTWFSWNHQHRRARVRAALTSSPRVLQVSTHKAVRLTVDSKFKFGSPDPYAALLTQHSTIHTAVQKGTYNPEWEETHLLALDAGVTVFAVEIYNRGGRSDTMLARQDVLFGELPAERDVELTIPLKVRHHNEWVDSQDTMLYLTLKARGPGWV
jgi:hypothetical protein